MPDPDHTAAAATATLAGARTHARAQAGAGAATGRTTPAASAVDLPAGVDPATVVWDETVGPGGYASRLLRRDTVVRLTDQHGDACAAIVVHHADLTSERLNVADTVKVQWQAYLGPGALLLSDLGRVLMTVVADASGRHDALCGTSNAVTTAARFGQSGIHSPTPSGRELLTVAAAKHDLTRRDVATAINLFKGVRVGDDGALQFEGAPTAPSYVELRAELDVLLLVANTPHPLDDRDAYTATPLRCTAWRAERPDPDPFRTSTPERQRAFENTEDLRCQRW